MHHVWHIPGRRNIVGPMRTVPELLFVVLDERFGDQAGCVSDDRGVLIRPLIDDVCDVVIEEKFLRGRVQLANVRNQYLADDDVGVTINPEVLVLVCQVGFTLCHQLLV